MLKLFFHRNSLFVKIAYWSAFTLTVLYFFKGRLEFLSLIEKIFLFLFLFQILFAQIVEIYPWYPKGAKGPGIRLQFQKAIVPASYIWLVLIIFIWMNVLIIPLIFFNILMLPISIVACILIYFHCIDPDPSSPNELSGGYQYANDLQACLRKEIEIRKSEIYQ